MRSRAAPQLWIVAGIALIAAVASATAWGPLGRLFEHEVGLWQNTIARRLHGPGALDGWRLYPIAFGGGLVASISPCILGMLPLNLSYIGASKLTSRVAALRVASMFVLGVIAVNVALGLVSSLFFTLFVQYRAPVNIGVGALTIIMGLWMAGLVQLPTPQIGTRIPPEAARSSSGWCSRSSHLRARAPSWSSCSERFLLPAHPYAPSAR